MTEKQLREYNLRKGNASNFALSPRGDKVSSLKIMRFSMFSRFTFEQLHWIIPVTEKSLSEQCEGGLKCCATGKPEKLFRIERMCSVILSANRCIYIYVCVCAS